jgi:cysteinyl-tRNA synthetase
MDVFKSMVQDLKDAASTKSSEKAKKLVFGIIPYFESAMNDDLNVKAAFDGIFNIVLKLDNLKENKQLNPQDAKVALEALERVDRVLRIVF